MTRLRARPRTDRTHRGRRKGHIAARAGRRLCQGEIDPYGDVTPALDPAPSSAAKAETPAEELLQDVVEAAEVAEQISRRELLAPVVGGPPVLVGEHFIGLGDLPERGFGSRIVGIGVGMGIPGELTESLLDVLC